MESCYHHREGWAKQMTPASIELLALCCPSNGETLHEGIREREKSEGCFVIAFSSEFVISGLSSVIAAIVVTTFVAIPFSAIWQALHVSLVNELS